MELRLRELREDSDKRQKELAAYLKCTQQTYSRYENGKAQPSLEIMALLADFYNTSVDYLMMRTDDPKPPALRRK